MNIDDLFQIKIKQIPFKKTSNGYKLNWKSLGNKAPNFGGIYAFWWKGSANHFIKSIQNNFFIYSGPSKKEIFLKVDKNIIREAKNGMVPLYVGKTAANISKRIGLHLKLQTKRTVAKKMVKVYSKKMTPSCQLRDGIDRLFPNIMDTRKLVLENIAISYIKICGENNFFERFFLENYAIGLLRPIFNIDSER